MKKNIHLWREEDHPRDKDGKFCRVNHLGEKVVDKNSKSDTIKKKKSNVSLTKQEWAMWYEKIGEIKRECFFHCSPKGCYYLPIKNKLVVTQYNYVSPKVVEIFEFEDENKVHEYLSRI